MLKFAAALILSPIALVPGAALAQVGRTPVPAAPQPPVAGAKVFDPQGVEAGTIESVTAQAVVINTGTNKVPVPPTAVAAGVKGPTVSMTKAQLDAAFTQQQAQAQGAFKAQLVAGAKVYGTGGTELGTIKSVDAQSVTMTRGTTDLRLPITGFGPGAQGVTLGMTAEQLDAAVVASGGTAAAPAAGAAATTTTTAPATGAATTTSTTAPAMGAAATTTNSTSSTTATTDPSTGATETTTTTTSKSSDQPGTTTTKKTKTKTKTEPK